MAVISRKIIQTVIIFILCVLACLLTVYFQGILGQTILFTHFFYIPIILAILWWGYWGLLICIFLSAMLFFSNLYFQLPLTVDLYARSGMFIVVSLVLVFLREKARAAQQKADQMHAELTHADRLSVLGETSGELAHELNQPLCAIRTHGNACRRMILNQQGTADEWIDMLEQIDRQSERAGEILRHIREFSRKTSPYSPTKVNLNTVARRAAAFVFALNKKHHQIQVRYDLYDALTSIAVREIQIEQVLVNIIRNSFEAYLENNNEEDKTVTIATRQDHSAIRVSVRDHASRGLTLNLDRLFEPFFTTKAQGLGLGLSVSKKIIEAHGGRIWADITPDNETVITFQLPL
ncbi:MAG: hypothetical protein JW709_09785 [Sedimentisphaerales bacterium]|nr:hypothetical protein [Sedimentisphaerales bacterium]